MRVVDEPSFEIREDKNWHTTNVIMPRVNKKFRYKIITIGHDQSGEGNLLVKA